MNIIDAEDTFFQVKKSLNCKGRLLDLSTPAIMGILNITPDSFYDGGKYENEHSIITHVESMINNGAAILDIGGQSTRPGAATENSEVEWSRISPVLKIISSRFPKAIASVDTFYSDVAEKAINEGASMINDVSGGEFDKNMYAVISKLKVPYVLMHTKGNPSNMQDDPQYGNVTEELVDYFVQKYTMIREYGITDIVIDPGFGFGKTLEHNYILLQNLSVFKIFNCPVLAGISRKSMITRVLNVSPGEALTGTIALHSIALLNGANILRVHDVKEAVETKKIINQYMLIQK